MNTAPTPEPTSAPAANNGPRPSTPSLVDGIGDRLVTYDSVAATTVEVLRIRREFSDAPGFETALRTRVDELARLRHPSLTTVRNVVQLDEGEGLTLVSTHVPGRRLCDMIEVARGPQFATELIQQIGPAIALLHQQGKGVAHGLLTPERITVTREGRLVVLEHVLALAFESLRLPSARLRNDLKLAVRTSVDPDAFDAKADVLQLGFIALSLLVGRRLDPADYPSQISARLDEAIEADPSAARFRQWIERAMQLGDRTFDSARDAVSAFNHLPRDLASGLFDTPRTGVLAFRPSGTDGKPALASTPVLGSPRPVVVAPVARTPVPVEPQAPAPPRVPAPVATPAHVPAAPVDVAPAADTMRPAPAPAVTAPAAAAAPAPSPAPSAEPPRAKKASRFAGWMWWAAIGFGVLAGLEALVLVGVFSTSPTIETEPIGELATPSVFDHTPPVGPLAAPPAAPFSPANAAAGAPIAAGFGPAGTATQPAQAAAPPPVETSAPPPVERPQPPPAPPTPPAASTRASNPTTEPPAADPGRSAGAAAGAAGRIGGLSVTSSIELQVFEDGKVVGSTAAPVALTEGSHTLELVNTTLGFRLVQPVTVRAGRMTPLNIQVPNGHLSVNAVPWAEVLIDGKSYGETPLANIALPIGTHEIVFRHPQLGEQKQTVIVKMEGLTRASATFRTPNR